MSDDTPSSKDRPESPFPPTEYDKFRATGQVFTRDMAVPKDNRTLENLRTDEDHFGGGFSKIVERLAGLGFRRIHQQVQHGKFAIVLEADNHQKIRIITKARKEARYSDGYYLQPTASYEHKGYRIDILPKVHTLREILDDQKLMSEYGIEREGAGEFLKQLVFEAWKNHQFFSDAKFDNIAILKNSEGKAVPVILDPGASCAMKEATNPIGASVGSISALEYFFIQHSDLRDEWVNYIASQNIVFHTTDDKLLSMIDYLEHAAGEYQGHPPEYYTVAQAYHRKSLGLNDKGITGVLDDAQLEDLLKEMTEIKEEYGYHYNPVRIEALKNGVSHNHFDHAMKRVIKSYVPDRRGFCEQIRQELVNDQALPPKTR